MVEISTLSPGDRVRIISDWSLGDGSQNRGGQMDHWLGRVMTVRRINPRRADVFMVEDDGENGGDGWYWSGALIECLEDEPEYPEQELPSDADFLALFAQKGGLVHDER